MTKTQKIFGFLVVLPLILAYWYDRQFEYSGNWLEDYQNHFKLGFLIVSIVSTLWIIILSKKENNYLWLITSIVIFLILIYIFLVGINLTNISF